VTGASSFPHRARFLRWPLAVKRSLDDLALPAAFIGAALGGLLTLRERRHRLAAERFAAATLETLLNAIDANDPDTGRHVRRVARYALILADALGLSEEDAHSIERVAIFHDIGKIHQALFDIVHDGAKLSAEDRRAIATHPQRGADVLRPLAAFYPELPAAVCAHHERWDGSGYPRGLAGRRIPLASRIVALADTFDAITHARRYRSAKGAHAASAAIREGAGTQFDPALVDVMCSDEVFARLMDAHRAAHRPVGRGERRQGEQESRAPDISFRWRQPSHVLRDA
jgi:putative nucleotidyltransferase with HDIG domain